jgi:hypothetical protein
MKIPIGPSFELQNMVRTSDGLRTRLGFASLATPTSGTVFVGGFTVESPSTTEPWHYLVEQSTTTLACTLRVFTEEFVELFNFPLGVLQEDLVIRWAVVNNQLLISSPSFSATLFGMPGGGLISATKTLSEDPTVVTLDVPAGHIASFGSQVAVGVGPLIYFNQPRRDLDPRTFTAEGVQGFPGTIYDVFQGVDGQLYVFTSAGVFTIAADALGQGQNPSAFISRVPGISVSRPRNAVATDEGVAVLQRDSVLMLSGGSQKKIDLSTSDGPRVFGRVVDVDDLRFFGEIYSVPEGFVVGFRGARNFFIAGDLRTGSMSYVYAAAATPMNLVGTLRSRDGEAILVMSTRVLGQWMAGSLDFDGVAIRGVASSALELDPDDDPVLRRATVVADNAGAAVGVAVNGVTDTDTTPTLTGDVVLGTSSWSASGTMAGRTTRQTRVTLNKRSSEPIVEVFIEGGDRRVGDIDVELGGLHRGKRDRQR